MWDYNRESDVKQSGTQEIKPSPVSGRAFITVVTLS